MRKTVTMALATVVTVLGTATGANASVTFDAATGTGFVGKGDVQTAMGWNNHQLQAAVQSGGVVFTYQAVTVQETSWTCLNQNNGHEQERTRTTTSTVSGVTAHTARERNQVTGFYLDGYAEGSSQTSETDGPPLQSCPNANSSFVLDSTTVGEPTVLSGGLYVNGVQIA